MKYSRWIAPFLFGMLMLCAAGECVAQSGRRAKGGTPPPRPVSTPAGDEKSETKPTASAEAQRLPLIVAADEHTFESVLAPVNASNIILAGFIERLKKSSAITVKVEKDMGRQRSIELARKQTEAYLVWLHFGSDTVSARSHDEQDYYVDYAVFTPATAKVKTQGKVYLRPVRSSARVGGVPIGLPLPQTNSRAAWESALRQAGSDAAERIMGEFDVTLR